MQFSRTILLRDPTHVLAWRLTSKSSMTIPRTTSPTPRGNTDGSEETGSCCVGAWASWLPSRDRKRKGSNCPLSPAGRSSTTLEGASLRSISSCSSYWFGWSSRSVGSYRVPAWPFCSSSSLGLFPSLYLSFRLPAMVRLHGEPIIARYFAVSLLFIQF